MINRTTALPQMYPKIMYVLKMLSPKLQLNVLALDVTDQVLRTITGQIDVSLIKPRFSNRGPDPENCRGSKIGVGGVATPQGESPTNFSKTP